MKCFIAMTFGRNDTDLMYNSGIRPALTARAINPVRLDQLEHNDNINDRIIREIQTADFAIVDLTYARPSVYYEAGFAERTIPVIYTVRRDHFSPVVDDEFGVFKVHFDLTMKNIIDWIPDEDNNFIARLMSRVDLVIKPLNEDLSEKRKQKEQAEKFSWLSDSAQIHSIKKIVV